MIDDVIRTDKSLSTGKAFPKQSKFTVFSYVKRLDKEQI